MMQTAAAPDEATESTMATALRAAWEADPAAAARLADEVGRNPLIAHHAFVCRDSPELLRLLAGSVARPAEDAPSAAPVAEALPASVLIARAAKAVARWGITGFRRATPEMVSRRWAACTSCPHLSAAPRTVLHRITSGDGDSRVCGLCGCTASRKVRLPTEHCPDRHPTDARLTRWSEPAEPSADS